MADTPVPSTALVTIVLIIVQVLFGLNYVISKVVVGAFPPLVWASIRATVTAVILLSVAILARRKRPEFSKKFFVPLIGYSLLGIIINQGSFLVGLRYTTATNSAILNTLQRANRNPEALMKGSLPELLRCRL